MADKDEKEEVVSTADPMLLKVLDKLAPPGIQEILDKQMADFEEPYRLHPDMVAVFDVTTNSAALTDAVPGTYDVVTGSKLDREVRGEQAKAEFTKQGARITDRYQVVINHIPSTDRIHKYTIVPRKQWEEYQASKAKGMVSPMQELAGMMLRSGGAI